MLDFVIYCYFCRLRASDIMESCLSYVYPHTRVHSLVGILKTTAHNAFPVVTVDKNRPEATSDEDYDGNPASTNEQYACITTETHLTSEQKVRGSSLMDEMSGVRHRSSTQDSLSHGYRPAVPEPTDTFPYSASAPLLSADAMKAVKAEETNQSYGKCIV